jgi:FAD dependent oxidoreductase
MEGRQQASRAARYLRATVPGCGQGDLMAFGTQVGVRETRRVEGEHILTAEELLEPAQFDDAIALGAYPIDIHPASGGGLHYQTLGEDHAYQIPYRSLIPTAFDNALTAGRGVSATHTALAAIRVMTISMAVGQAAGTAAALACDRRHGSNDSRIDVRAVSISKLRALLEKDGACPS